MKEGNRVEQRLPFSGCRVTEQIITEAMTKIERPRVIFSFAYDYDLQRDLRQSTSVIEKMMKAHVSEATRNTSRNRKSFSSRRACRPAGRW